MASGDSLLQFHPYHNEPPSASYATLDTRNQRPMLDFDAGGSEAAIFGAILPQHYSGGGITARHWVSFSSATAGSGIILGTLEAVKEGSHDLDDDGWGSASTSTFAVPANSGSQTIVSIAFADGGAMDDASAGDSFRYRIQRDAENTVDDASGDLEIGSVEFQET